uniref:ZP domain-containing protein n=1 Tax=Trichuris muris TaxID=70415 RepID=A0A5S6QS99_TRIMR
MAEYMGLLALACVLVVVESLQHQRVVANFESFASVGKGRPDTSDIADVGIQCSVNGITAKFQFYNPFNGRIYSTNFQHDLSCMYYDEYGEQHVLFVVPSFRCGTRSWRNSQNKVVHLENEIYVQLDKYRKSRDDKRYIFVCKEKSPERLDQRAQWKKKEGVVHSFQGEETVLVQTVSLPRMSINGHGSSEQPKYSVEVFVLEGKGLDGKRIQRTVNLGEPITLVVKGPRLSDDKFQMFVHSCYAHDNRNGDRVDLVDKTGCPQQPSITGPMMRKHDEQSTVYYITFGAFRFPQTENVSFVCSVDFCDNCAYMEPCHFAEEVEKSESSRKNATLRL